MDATEKWNWFISGDNDAYAHLYQDHVQILYHYGLCFTPDTDLIKDCIQDLFVYLYAHRNHLDKPRNVKAYLLVSLKNNLCRKLTQRNSFGSLSEEIPFLSEISVEDKFIEDELQQNESRRVKEMLSILTSRQREILYYRFIQELSMEDICRLMDLNYQSAQNLIQRSLKKIRETYGDFFLCMCILYPANFFAEYLKKIPF